MKLTSHVQKACTSEDELDTAATSQPWSHCNRLHSELISVTKTQIIIIINVINNCCFTQLVNIDIFHETVLSSLSQVLNFF